MLIRKNNNDIELSNEIGGVKKCRVPDCNKYILNSLFMFSQKVIFLKTGGPQGQLIDKQKQSLFCKRVR